MFYIAQAEYDMLRPLAYAAADVFLIVYSIGSPSTFERAQSMVSALHGTLG